LQLPRLSYELLVTYQVVLIHQLEIDSDYVPTFLDGNAKYVTNPKKVGLAGKYNRNWKPVPPKKAVLPSKITPKKSVLPSIVTPKKSAVPSKVTIHNRIQTKIKERRKNEMVLEFFGSTVLRIPGNF
jgi:hypothetical protein